MFEIGNTLREARLRRRLDILQCEAETKIRAKYLRAMEEEQFDLMPSPTYVRGFLRTYADFLDLDGQLVLDEYESRFGIYEAAPDHAEPWRPNTARQGSPGTPPRRAHGETSRRPSRRPRGRRTELRLLWLAIGGVMAVALLVWMGVGGTSDPTPGGVPGVASMTTGPGGTTTTEESIADPDTSLAEAPMKPPLARVVLEGVGDIGSWVAVRAIDGDGRQIWESTLTPGQAKTFGTRRSIHITTGNSAGLRVTINGEEQTLEGTTGQWILSIDGAQSVE